MSSAVIISGGRRWAGVAAMLAVIGALLLTHWRYAPVPSPPAVLVLALVFATFHGGTLVGLVSAGLAWLYLVWFLPIRNTEPPAEAQANMVRLALWAVSLPASVLLIGRLKARWLGTLREAKGLADAQRELRESREEYRRIIETTHEGVWTVDAEGRTTFANERLATMLGTTVSRLIGRPAIESVPEEDRADAAKALARRQRGEAETREMRLRKMDGSEIWAIVSSTPRAGKGSAYAGATALVRDVTEERTAKESLKRSEERYRQFFDTNPAPKWVLNAATGAILEANQTAADFYGIPVERLRKMTVFEVNQAPREQIRAALDRAARECVRFEAKHRLASGEVREVEVYSGPLDDGGARCVMSIIHDVTDRRRAEDAMRVSTERYRALSELSTDFAMQAELTQDLTMRTVWTIGSFEALVGRSVEAANAGDGWGQLVHPEDRELAAADLRCLLAGQRVEREVRLLRPDGSVRWIHASSKPDVDAEGRVRGFFSAVRDITDRKRADDALLERERELRVLLERLPIGWVTFDEKLRFTGLNPAAERIFGWTCAELIGKDALETIVPPEALASVRQVVERLNVGDMAAHSTNENLTKGGGRVMCRWSNTPLNDEQGRHAGVLSMVEDVTNEHRLEQELRQSQKMEAVGQLASGVAHDFSNLLSAIFGHTSLARRTLEATHPAHRSLDRVEEAARQAGGVTKALLTFTRGGITEKADVQLGTVVEETVRLLRRTLPPNITIESELELAWVHADPTQLQQVVLNLAINARDAMPGGGMLRLRVSAEGNEATLRVSDTGVGMTVDVRRRVFEPFFTTKPPGKGTGLGLAVVHGIVTGHGGRIEVRSKLGVGSEFEVRLPRVEVLSSVSAMPGSGRLALLVEDHRYVREIVGSMLQSLGFEVIHAVDFQSLLDVFKQRRERVGLVVVDEATSGASGVECARAIRGMGSATPIVLMVADSVEPGQDGVEPRARVLRKPFQMAALAEVVREAQSETTSLSEGQPHESSNHGPAGG
ncbi:MAG: PAS domain S-box protein [Phycisphaerales bacterium]